MLPIALRRLASLPFSRLCVSLPSSRTAPALAIACNGPRGRLGSTRAIAGAHSRNMATDAGVHEQVRSSGRPNTRSSARTKRSSTANTSQSMAGVATTPSAGADAGVDAVRGTLSTASAASSASATSPSSQGVSFLLAMRTGLSLVGSPSKAMGMQSYLKSAIPCHGVYSADCRTVWEKVHRTSPPLTFTSLAEWSDTIRHVWDAATHREERYGAIALTRIAASAPFRSQLASLDLYRYLVSSGAWWDFNDGLSSSQVGDVLRAHPEETKSILREWSAGNDLWLRRAAIIAQLSSKGDEMDLPFLFEMILPAIDSEEFFLRKAIGWALRQAAREYPKEIVTFVAAHESQLSPLSIREALKHFGRTVVAAQRIVGSAKTTINKKRKNNNKRPTAPPPVDAETTPGVEEPEEAKADLESTERPARKKRKAAKSRLV